MSVGIVAANTSISPAGLWPVIRCPPQTLQYIRWLKAVFSNVAICSAPVLTCTASAFQRLKALTGPPDQERQEPQ